MSDTPHAPRASMKGVSGLIREILDNLEKAPPPQPDFAAHEGPQRDPEAAGPMTSLGAIADRLDERGFGILLFLLALPCVPPFVYVLPQIVSVPMLVLAGQMAMGRRAPWLPNTLRKRPVSIAAFRDVVDRSEKYVRFAERLAHPRLRPVTGHGAARIVGALLAIPALSIMVPFPGTNTVPGIGVAVTALGLVERDGVLVIAGLLIGVGWVALLLVLGLEAATLIKDWLLARF
ncbi:MAG TPA: exopolysaccharide biosynthesis protein [Parvularculaceae bacterium]|nr:exopolysaccharide biosynthesis protein [Caulobacterales bacterium]HPE30991.1 exopolysaccharide biosynthesis protein [Parvularculaceae bacterium]HRX39254.1 exopolysaccharide biosynthesis protein [Parvularculaceae bacterium]